MTEADRRIILSCFANGFEFRKDMEHNKLAEVKTLTGVETLTIEYMEKLAGILTEALDKQAISDKYKWHDLRKDPDDLPEVNPTNTYDNDVLLVVDYAVHPEKGRNIYKGHLKDRVEKLIENTSGTDNVWGIPTYDVNWTIWGWSYFNAPKVIAWREIEPFTDDYIMPENSDHRKQRGRTTPNIEDAIAELRNQYERCNSWEAVKHPVAYALYQTWLVFDKNATKEER